MPQEPPLLTANGDPITQKDQRPGNRALHFQHQTVLHLEKGVLVEAAKSQHGVVVGGGA